MRLPWHLPRYQARGLLTDQRLQARPVRARSHQSPLLAGSYLTLLAEPVAFVALLVGGGLEPQGGKMGGHLPVQLPLVLLESQDVIRPSRHELRRRCPLATHRIERNDTAPNLHQVEHLRDGD